MAKIDWAVTFGPKDETPLNRQLIPDVIKKRSTRHCCLFGSNKFFLDMAKRGEARKTSDSFSKKIRVTPQKVVTTETKVLLKMNKPVKNKTQPNKKNK